MTISVHLGALFLSDLGVELFDDLAKLYPEGVHGHYFECDLPEGDEQLGRILSRLDAAGWRPWSNPFQKFNKAEQFRITRRRIYAGSDFAHVTLFELTPNEEVEGAFRSDDDGLILLDGRHLKPTVDFATAGLNRYVVPQHIKNKIEDMNFLHVVFRPTLLSGGNFAKDLLKPIPWESYGDPWWELRSDYQLPAVSSSMELLGANGQAVRDGSNGCYRREDAFLHAELHYRQSEVRSLERFDAAHTLEFFDGRRNKWGERPLIFSRRFYEFCIEQGFSAAWAPVRFDAE